MKFDQGIVKLRAGSRTKTIKFRDLSDYQEDGLVLDIKTENIRNGEIYSIILKTKEKCQLEKIGRIFNG